ncbi:MAG TPA: GNAT family N-acetyltransferase [Pyrinomonadaceae bacterium]|jgi:N-acetylglutamate synthase-like GNAT family acetyltransferase|nr:GNAT family N-acetyltransferase [Pyrinomonadaceae bacterium]
MPPRLRLAQVQDTDGIQRLIAEVYGEYDCTLDVERDEPYLTDPAKYFRESGGELWVVEDEGVVKASGAVLLHADSAELKTLYVHRSLRRQGWARQLVQMAIDHTRRAGLRQMILWSDTRFLDAHRLYTNMGFLQTGKRELKDANNSIEYGFELALSEPAPGS